METDFLSIRVEILNKLVPATFLMRRIKNVRTSRVLKNYLGGQGT